jgi:riboflavin synthase
VPHTLQETTMEGYRPGSEVNLEVDLIARYLERLMLGERAADPEPAVGITEALLKSRGFIR